MRSYIARDPGRRLFLRGLLRQRRHRRRAGRRSSSTLTVKGEHDALRLHRHRGRARAGRCNISRNTTLSTLLRRAQAHLPRRAGQRRHFPADHASPCRTARMLAAEYPAPVGGYLEPVGPRPRRRLRRARAGDSRQGARAVLRHHRRRRRSAARIRAAEGYFVGVFPYPGGYGALAAERRPRQRQAAAIDGELHVARNVASTASRSASTTSRCARIPAARAGIAAAAAPTYWLHRLVATCSVSVLGDRARSRAVRRRAAAVAAAPNRVEFTHRRPQLVAGVRRQAGEAARCASGDAIRVGVAGRRRLRRSARRATSTRSSATSTSATSARATAETRLRRRDRRSGERSRRGRELYASTPRRAPSAASRSGASRSMTSKTSRSTPDASARVTNARRLPAAAGDLPEELRHAPRNRCAASCSRK